MRGVDPARPQNDGPHGPQSRAAVEREGFDRSWEVRTISSLAEVIAPDERCGIYLLAFTSGDWYVGKAVDVARRFLEHRRNFGDIDRVFFKRVEPDDLRREELRLIGLLETTWGWSVKNERGASLPKGPSDLHEVVPEAVVDRWIRDPMYDTELGDPKSLDDQARKLADKNLALEKHPRAADVRKLVSRYLAKAVPSARATELDFWSLSCLPGGSYTALVRVNLHWQEVFTIIEEADLRITASFHVARTPLGGSLFRRLLLRLRHPALKLNPHAYEPGGADQVQVTVVGVKAIERLIGDPRFLQAARLLNARLMRKGNVNSGNAVSHCAGWVRDLEIERFARPAVGQ